MIYPDVREYSQTTQNNANNDMFCVVNNHHCNCFRCYVAWTNNETGHWQVFFATSIDSGKTFDKTVALSDNSTTPINPQTTASGSNVYVIWWGDKIGYFEPSVRAITDNGATFGKIMKLNGTSTSGILSR